MVYVRQKGFVTPARAFSKGVESGVPLSCLIRCPRAQKPDDREPFGTSVLGGPFRDTVSTRNWAATRRPKPKASKHTPKNEAKARDHVPGNPEPLYLAAG